MAHTVYENAVIANQVANFMDTSLGHSPFYTVDASLAQSAGMKKIINKYTAEGAVRDVAMTEGNLVADDVEVSFTPVEYEVAYVQGRFPYYDEEVMTDPMLVPVGLEKMAANMANDLTTKFYRELAKASRYQIYKTALSFDNIVDATSQFGENEEGLFLLINPAQKAALRKALKDSLEYTEGFVRTGYIGSINNIPVYVSVLVPENVAYIANKAAVTVFVKKEVETEQERDANTRKNSIYNRRCNVVALTDATKVVKLFDETSAVKSVKGISVEQNAELPETVEITLTDDSKLIIPAVYAGTYATDTLGVISSTKIKVGTTEYAVVITVVAGD
jgi:hypothetical protein